MPWTICCETIYGPSAIRSATLVLSVHQYPPPPPPPPEKSHLLPVQNPPDRRQSSSAENCVVEEPAHPIRRVAAVSAPMRPRRMCMTSRLLHRAIEHPQPALPTRRHSSVVSHVDVRSRRIHETFRALSATESDYPGRVERCSSRYS